MQTGEPLNGILVVELATVLAGPSVGQFFAELGARVIKVEHPIGGDVTRSWPAPGQLADEVSAYFASCNHGKESVAINLGREPGRELLLRLVDRADILTTSLRKDSADRLGLTAEALRRRNDHLVVGRISGYGHDQNRPGYDAIIQAESGFMSMNGSPGGEPLKMPVALIDLLAAHQLKEGILVALLARGRTGVGTIVDVSLIDAAVSSLANQGTNYLATRRVPESLGSAHPNIAPYGSVFETADRKRIVLAVGTDTQFKRLCVVLHAPELADAPLFCANPDRVSNRVELERTLAALIVDWHRDALLSELLEVGVPAGAVRRLDEVFELSSSNQMVLDGLGGGARASGLRQAVFHEPPEGLRPPPRLGEHTAHVLRELCSASDDELRAAGLPGRDPS